MTVKTYTKKNVAASVAAGLSKKTGEAHLWWETVDGAFNVGTQAERDAEVQAPQEPDEDEVRPQEIMSQGRDEVTAVVTLVRETPCFLLVTGLDGRTHEIGKQYVRYETHSPGSVGITAPLKYLKRNKLAA